MPDFTRFLGDLSARLSAARGDEIDVAIDAALDGLIAFLGTDRATFYLWDTATRSMIAQHQRALPGIPLDESPVLQNTPWYRERIVAGHVMSIASPDDIPPEAEAERRYVKSVGMKSNVTIPLSVGGRLVSVIATGAFRLERAWPPMDVDRIRIVGEILAAAVDRKNRDVALERSLEEVRTLKDQLAAENVLLREELESSSGFREIVGESAALKRTLARVAQVAPADSTVLLLGETGTGKELLARALHERSPRNGRSLVPVNCAAVPPALIESELFGHEKGAFTGAVATRIGRFELADRGTIFLDEIGDLGLDVQAKLLRVLQEGEIARVGSNHARKVDVRVVAATHHDLSAAVETGRFRADLFYRLNVFPIRVPPLRERREDVPLLVWWFIHRRQVHLRRKIEKVPRAAMERLQAYPWPGNIRELENVVERALILSPGTTLQLDESFASPESGSSKSAANRSMEDVERAHLTAVLEEKSWRIEGAGNAAGTLGLKPSTLRSRMRKLGIRRA
jgi:transcriptional regulator with GAF, ATPase, and Fis domain